MILYGYWRSSASWRVRIGLNLKGLAYDTVSVHLVKDGGEQKGTAHRARNPMAQVPVLEVDGVRLSQSLAILEYLDERWPEPPILPRDPLGRARARMLAEVVNSGIQPLQNLSVLAKVQGLGGDRDAWAREFITTGLTALEAAVAGDTTPFLVGEHPTIADICLVPQLYNARRYGADVTPWTRLLAVEARCLELPAFQAADPARQPDAVPV